MKALFTHGKRRIGGTLVAVAALAALGAPSAFAEPGRGLDPAIKAALADRAAQLTRDDWQLDAATRASFASGQSVPLDPAIVAAMRDRAAELPTWASGYSGIESLRTSSPVRSPVGSPVGSPVSDDGFQWTDAGIGAGMVIVLMLLAFLATFLVRLGGHQPRGA